MEIKREDKEGFVVLAIDGRMDAMTAGPFLEQCTEVVDSGATKVVVDLQGLEYVSSAGLRSFLAFAKGLRVNKGILRFSGLSGMVEEVFTVSGFSRMFDVFPSIDEAIARG